MGKMIGFLRLIRPLNCLMMGFAVIVGVSLVSPPTLSINIIFGFITSFTLTASSMAINDYYDREIDSINEPNRPIPKGDISAKEALYLADILIIIGLISAFKTNISSFFTALIALLISLFYITRGKRTGILGNFLVSISVIVPFIYGGLIIGNIQTPTILFVAIAFLSNTAREITKGIVDVEGDRSYNINTIAVIHGNKIAAIVGVILSFLAVGISPLPWLWGLVSNWFIPPIIITDVGIIISSFMLIHDYSRKNAKRIKNLSLLWFLVGLLAFILGRLF